MGRRPVRPTMSVMRSGAKAGDRGVEAALLGAACRSGSRRRARRGTCRRGTRATSIGFTRPRAAGPGTRATRIGAWSAMSGTSARAKVTVPRCGRAIAGHAGMLPWPKRASSRADRCARQSLGARRCCSWLRQCCCSHASAARPLGARRAPLRPHRRDGALDGVRRERARVVAPERRALHPEAATVLLAGGSGGRARRPRDGGCGAATLGARRDRTGRTHAPRSVRVCSAVRRATLGAALLLTAFEFARPSAPRTARRSARALRDAALVAFWHIDRGIGRRWLASSRCTRALGLAVLTKGPVGIPRTGPGDGVLPRLGATAADLRRAFPLVGISPLARTGARVDRRGDRARRRPASLATRWSTTCSDVSSPARSHDRPFYYYLYQFPADVPALDPARPRRLVADAACSGPGRRGPGRPTSGGGARGPGGGAGRACSLHGERRGRACAARGASCSHGSRRAVSSSSPPASAGSTWCRCCPPSRCCSRTRCAAGSRGARACRASSARRLHVGTAARRRHRRRRGRRRGSARIPLRRPRASSWPPSRARRSSPSGSSPWP